MRLSARERTALRAMVELAARHGQGPTPLAEVARAQGLTLPYLERVVALLRRSHLVESVRGAHGGYLLARPPQQISVGDVFRSVEGALVPLDCLRDDVPRCDRQPVCATRSVWQLVARRLGDTLDGTTLDDIIADAAPLAGRERNADPCLPS